MGNSGCWETTGYLMKAGPCVWLDPQRRDEYPRSLSWLLYVVCKVVVDLWSEGRLEISVVGLLRGSNNNNNNTTTTTTTTTI